MKLKRILAVFGFCCGVYTGCVNASLVYLDPMYSGEVHYERRDYIVPPGYPLPPPPPSIHYRHETPLTAFSLLWAASFGCMCSFEYVADAYLIYDLTSLVGPVQSASLQFDLGLDGAINVMNVHSVDSMTPSELALLPSGELSLAMGEILYEDLRSGTLLASQSLSPGTTQYDVTLAATAIDLINGTRPLLALALDHPISYYSLADIAFSTAPRLALEVASIPEPPTLWLVVLACVLVGARAQSQRGETFPRTCRIRLK